MNQPERTHPPVNGLSLSRRLIPVFIILALIAGFQISGLGELLRFENIQSHSDELHRMVREHPFISYLSFFLAYFTAVIFCIPIGSLLTVIAGFLFGIVPGGCVVLAANCSGSLVVFLLARSAFGAFLRERAKGFYARAAAEMEQSAINYMIFMRVIPVFPFLMLNVLPALFRVSTWNFFWTALAGSAPVAFIYAGVGQELGQARAIGDLLSPGMVAALVLLGILAVTPVLIKKVKARAARKT